MSSSPASCLSPSDRPPAVYETCPDPTLVSSVLQSSKYQPDSRLSPSSTNIHSSITPWTRLQGYYLDSNVPAISDPALMLFCPQSVLFSLRAAPLGYMACPLRRSSGNIRPSSDVILSFTLSSSPYRRPHWATGHLLLSHQTHLLTVLPVLPLLYAGRTWPSSL